MSETAPDPTKIEKRLVPILVHIFPSQNEALEKLGEKLRRSKSDLIREAVTVLLSNYTIGEEQDGKTSLD